MNTTRLTIVLAAVVLLAGASPAVVAQSDPGQPIAFYGDAVDEDGEAAPAGTTIVAAVDGTAVDSITVNEAGVYAGDGATDNKLRTTTAAGNTVTFHIGSADGPEAAETHSIDESGVFQQDLTFPAGEFDTVTASATIDDSGQAVLSFPDPDASEGITQATISLPDGVPADTRVSVQPSPGPTGGAEDRGSGAVYLDISPSNPVDGSTEVSVDLQQSTLDSFDNPSLYRYDGSSWNELENKNVDGNTITATSPDGLSPFAIDEASTDGGGDTGGDDDDDDTDASTGGGGGGGGGGGSLAADFLATNLDPTTTEVTQGDTISVSAEIESDGIAQDTQDVDLRIGGETIATQSVELSSDATTTVEFTDVTVDVDAGEYEYGVYTDDDSVTGTITVVADETADEEAATDEEADEEADAEPADEEGTAEEQADGATDDGIPGFGPLVAVLALVALALVARRKQ